MSINNPADLEITPVLPPVVPLPSETRFVKQLNPEDMALLQQQWDTFNQLRTAIVLENPIQRRTQQGGVDLPQGTLLHGTSYDLEKLQKIKDLGIISGELVGVPEDSETHFCADFFRVPEDMTVSQYLEWCSQPVVRGMLKTKRGEFNYLPTPGKPGQQIAYIIDTGDPRLQSLTKYDAYGSDSHERMESIVNVLPREIDPTPSRTTSAILIGIPGNFISGVVVADTILAEEVQKIKQVMGEKTLVYRTNGKVV